jgi:hypothetical protein
MNCSRCGRGGVPTANASISRALAALGVLCGLPQRRLVRERFQARVALHGS